ncbi:MAG: SpoIIE family protein phosphatase [Bacteroidota bacterium]
MPSSPKNSNLADRKKRESAFEAKSLFEFSKVINSSLDLSFILGDMLLTAMGKMMITKGVVLLRSTNNVFRVATQKGLTNTPQGGEFEIGRPPRTIILVRRRKSQLHHWIKHLKEDGIAIFFPLVSQSGVLGYVGLGEKIARDNFSEKEITFLQSLFNISATSIENSLLVENLRQTNRQLDLKIQELNTLFELSKEFSAVLDAEKLVKLLIFSLMGQVGVSRYVVFLRDGKAMKVAVSRLEGEFDDERFLKSLAEVDAPARIGDIKKKNLQSAREKLEPLGVKAIVPMQIQQELRGVLCLGEKMSREEYSTRDLEFLYSLGNLAIISLENARLFKEAIEKQRLEDELLIAREIQKGLLPSRLPEIAGFEIAATNISSKQVGGDYYDAISLGDSRYVLAIGDVSGKGTPASLLMANLQASIRALVPFSLSMSELTKRVNDLMFENTSSDRFVTFFWGLLDARKGSLNYVNAGHNHPYLVHADGKMERLEKGGMILGIMSTLVPYEEDTIYLKSGDSLVMFTDGVSEAMNRNAEEYGEPRLEEVLKRVHGKPAQEILDAIHLDVKKHTGDFSQSDDITLLILRAC